MKSLPFLITLNYRHRHHMRQCPRTLTYARYPPLIVASGCVCIPHLTNNNIINSYLAQLTVQSNEREMEKKFPFIKFQLRSKITQFR